MMKVIVAFYFIIGIIVLSNCVENTKVNSLNILGLFPYQGKSHFFVFERYMKELAKRGHNVTVVSYFPQKDKLENYYDISLAGKSKILEDMFPIEKTYWSIIQIITFLIEKGTENCRAMLSDENVQQLWKTKRKFDVIVVEQFNSDCSLGLAHVLDAPVVGITSCAMMPPHFSRSGVPFHPAFVPFLLLSGGTKPTLQQRFERVLFYFYFSTVYKVFNQRVDQNTLAEYFDDVPLLEELGRNIKFQLVYTNFVHFRSNILPQNVIEVGGYHVKEAKSLPDDLLKFIEESQHGVIYISFGSMLKTATTPRNKVKAIVGALEELPQRVVWKWEEKSIPGNPKNIFLSKWLPQNDILGHPNVLAFYSHSGMLGTTEALYHGVPILAMPIFGDQPLNAVLVEENGLGVQIEFMELTKEKLLQKFKQILDPGFRANVKLLSAAFKDQPTTAMDTAIHWTEFAARYRNMTFRSAAADVPLYQYLCLDVLIVIFGTFLAVTFIFLYVILVFLKKLVMGKQKKSKIE